MAFAGCDAPLRLERQTTGRTELPPSGLYRLTIDTPDAGPVSTIVAMQAEGRKCRGNSRPGAAGRLIGGFNGFLAELLMSQFRSGVLVRFSGGAAADGGMDGVLSSPIGTFRTSGPGIGGCMAMSAVQQIRGYARLDPVAPGSSEAGPTRDLKTVVHEVRGAFAQRLYDPALMDDARTRAFFARLDQVAELAKDDAEFLFGFYAARGRLPFSHVGLTRTAQQNSCSAAKAIASASRPSPATPKLSPVDERGIAVVRIDSFAVESSVIAHAMAGALAESPKALMIDLRECPGGTFSSLTVAAYLFDAPQDAGCLVGPAGRAAAKSGTWNQFPVLSQNATLEEMLRLTRAHGGVRGVVEPAAQVFRGPVAVLVSSQTASAAEPLVDLLKRTHRATIVGEQTAGAMLSSARVELAGGWTLILPELDYFTPDGRRIDGIGVQPDVVCRPSDAEQVARRRL